MISRMVLNFVLTLLLLVASVDANFVASGTSRLSRIDGSPFCQLVPSFRDFLLNKRFNECRVDQRLRRIELNDQTRKHGVAFQTTMGSLVKALSLSGGATIDSKNNTDEDRLRPRKRPHPHVSAYLTCVAVVSLWVGAGTLFYYAVHRSVGDDGEPAWPFHQAFFYAVDAGMSVGFCVDGVEERSTVSRAFTIAYVLVGASLVGAALGWFVEDVIASAPSPSSLSHDSFHWRYRRLLEDDAFRRAAAVEHAVAAAEAGAFLSHDGFRALVDGWRRDEGRPPLSDEDFARLRDAVDSNRDGVVWYDEFRRKGRHGIDRLIESFRDERRLSHRSVVVRTTARFLASVRALGSVEERRVGLVLAAWTAVGASWGVLSQGWDPVRAVHFAVSAMATGGLTAPRTNESEGTLAPGPAVFCGVYCLLGIPLFALTLGRLATRWLLENRRWALVDAVDDDHERCVHRHLDRDEFEFAKSSLCSPQDDRVHLSDFIVLQLLRQGNITMETVRLVRREFDRLDRDRSGTLSLEEACGISYATERQGS